MEKTLVLYDVEGNYGSNECERSRFSRAEKLESCLRDAASGSRIGSDRNRAQPPFGCAQATPGQPALRRPLLQVDGFPIATRTRITSLPPFTVLHPRACSLRRDYTLATYILKTEWPLSAHLARSGGCWRTSLHRTPNSRSPPATGPARLSFGCFWLVLLGGRWYLRRKRAGREEIREALGEDF
jgi:hypothetical protein